MILKILYCLTVTVWCQEDQDAVEREAVFITRPQNLMVNQGDTIRLPCYVDNIEGSVLLWKFGETILTVGGRVIDKSDKHQRLELHEENNGNYLVISGAESEDSGSYQCQISSFVPRHIQHNVIVRTRPLVTVEPGSVEARQGDNVSLTCSVVSGQPRPEISWSPPAGALDTSHLYNDTLLLTNVSGGESGVYQCHADNGHPEQHSASVSVQVSHPPVLDQSLHWIQSSQPGLHSLQCRVLFSHPPAQVLMFTSEEYQLNTSLALDNVTQTGDLWSVSVNIDDLSQDRKFHCVAENDEGESEMMIVVSRRPDSPQISHNQTMLVITVKSDVPVTKFNLETRAGTQLIKHVLTAEKTDNNTWTGHHKLGDRDNVPVIVRAVNQFGAGAWSQWTTVKRGSVSQGVHHYLSTALSLSLLRVILL